jgi:hypothetical protein
MTDTFCVPADDGLSDYLADIDVAGKFYYMAG